MPAPDHRPGRPVDPVPPGPRRRPATAGATLFGVGIAVLVVALVATVLVAGDGAGWLARLLPDPAGPTTAPVAAASPAPTPAAVATRSPQRPAEATPHPATQAPAATPAPPDATEPPPVATGPFTMNLYKEGVFVHQADKLWCVAAAAQSMLNVIRLGEDGATPDTSARTQRALYRRIVELTTWEDSHNGGTGPGGWAALLTEQGYPYEVRVFKTRNGALRAAATAVRETQRPVGILAWAGVHSWVLTGFTATADPAATRDFRVTAARVLDPWYPWVSDRWPRSESPNAPRNSADLEANFLRWRLASGPYEGRDGRYLLVVPIAD